jgi:hypothetical protein
MASSQTAAAKLPVTILLRLECRGRKDVTNEYYETTVEKEAEATLEDFKPFVLEKSGSSGFGDFVTRTRLTVEQYDPQDRRLLLSHSLPRSKASDFAFDLEYGHGFKRNRSLR